MPTRVVLTIGLVLAGLAAPGAADDALELSRLFKKMRENSALYQHFEAECTRDLVADKPIPGFDLDHQYRRQVRRYRLVCQGARYYFRIHEQAEMQDGSKREWKSEQGYDGELTRMNSKGQIGNIDDRRISPRVLPPHRLAMPEWGEHDPADVLELSDKIRADNRFDRLARVENRIRGPVEWKGLRCVEVESLAYAPNQEKPATRYVFTIAPERNYLLVRTLRYFIQLSDTSPEGEYETDDWRELAPGVWCPFRCVERVFRPVGEGELPGVKPVLGEPATMVPESVITHTVHSLSLTPNHDLKLFQGIAMPRGVEVHILKGGEIVETQIDGVRVERKAAVPPEAESPEPESSGSSSSAVPWLAASAILIALAAVYVRWRHRRSSKLTPERP